MTDETLFNFLNDNIINLVLKKLYFNMQKCNKCNLGTITINCLNHEEDSGKLPGFGDCNSKILFIAQQPSYFRKGFKVFGSPSTANRTDLYFETGLKSLGLKRNDVFVTNLIKCSSYKNELICNNTLDCCPAYWLNTEINIINPKVIVAVGKIASDHLGAIRGKLRKYNDTIKITSIYHPSYVVRGGMSIENYKKEFIKLKEILNDEGIIKK